MFVQGSSDRLNFFAIVIAELAFDLFKSFAHSFRNEESGKGYRHKTYCREDKERCLQTETVEQCREEKSYNKIGNPHE